MSKNSNKWTSADSWEVLIIGLCILLLLFGVTSFVVKQWWLTPQPQRIEVVIVPQDSLSTSNAYDCKSIDSLVSSINASITANEAKYESLSKKQDDERFKSLASMLIGIISSIALFFGYKSFRDIREKGEETSRAVAKETADQVAKDAAKEYLKSKLPDIVKDELNEGLYNKQVIDSTKASIIAEIKPILLNELKHEENAKGIETRVKTEHGKALDSDEMFGVSPSISPTVLSEPVSPAAQSDTTVQSEKTGADGKD